MPAGQLHEDVFQAGLPRGEMDQSRSLLLYRREQRWNGFVRLVHLKREHAVVRPYRLHAGKAAPQLTVVIAVGRDGKLDHMMSGEPFDQLRRRAFRNDLPVIDDGEAVAQTLRFIHIMRGEQDGAVAPLELPHDVPELTAALRIEPGGGLVEKQNSRIGHQRCRNRQPLLLSAGKLADPGIRFFLSDSSSRTSSTDVDAR